ncbi:MAG: SGNH/GDSL hydrolase family protein [Bacilli bacterium]
MKYKTNIFKRLIISSLLIISFSSCQNNSSASVIPSASPESESIEVSDSTEIKKQKIACLGDSITYGYALNNRDDVYVNLLSQEDYAQSVQNLGLGGTTIGNSHVDYYLARTFLRRYTQIEADTDIIIVFGGTNDYGSEKDQGVALGELFDTNQSTFYWAVEKLIDSIQSDYPEAKLIFATPLQRNDARWGYPSTSPINQYGSTLEEYRDAIAELCKLYELPVVDLYNLEGMRASDSTFDSLLVDGLHPNPEGQKKIEEAIDQVIREEINK